MQPSFQLPTAKPKNVMENEAMKRFHVSLSVSDLGQSKAFYSRMFGAEPTLEREHYVQWELEDPSINFVVEDNGVDPGVTHLGICLLYTSPSPRDQRGYRMPSSA